MKKAFLGLGILLIFLSSCNPVERVLAKPKYFQQVKDTVLARGYCVNDTVFETKVDTTVVLRDTTITESFPVYLTKECDIDTTLSSLGLRFVVQDGVVTVRKTMQWEDLHTTKIVESIVTDRAKEKVLQKTINDRERSLKQAEAEVEKLRKTLNQYRIYIAVAVGVFVLVVFLFRR